MLLGEHLETPSFVVPSPQDDQATAAHTNGEDSLFVAETDHPSLTLSDGQLTLTEQEMASILQSFNGVDGETSPVQPLSQALPQLDPRASQTEKGSVTALVDDSQDQRSFKTPSVRPTSSSPSSSPLSIGDEKDLVVDFPDVPDDIEDQECPSEWPEEEIERSAQGDLSKAK